MKDLLKNKKLLWFSICTYLIFIGIISCFYIPINKSTWISMDAAFHFSRLQGLSNYLKSPVNFNNFAHIGKMVNVFYPPITLMPMLLVQAVTKNWLLTFNISFYIYSIVTSFTAFYSMKKFTNSNVKALLFATLWTLSSTRASRLIFFSALGNIAAMAFIPLVILGAYNVFFGDYKKWYIFVIGLLLIIYSHLLTFMLVAIVVIVIFIVSIFRTKYDKNRVTNLAIAIVTLGLGSVCVLLPIYEQTRAYQLFLPDINLHIGKYSLIDIFRESFLNNNDFGLISIILLILISFRFKILSSYERSLFYASILLLILGTRLAPWNVLLHTPLATVQFASRFQMFSSISILIIFSNKYKQLLFIEKLDIKYIKLIFVVLFAAIVALYVNSSNNIYKTLKDQVKRQHLNTSHFPQHAILDYWHRDYTNKGYAFGKYTSKKKRHSSWGKELVKNRRKFTIDSKVVNIKPKYDANNFKFKYYNNQTNTKLVVPISVYKGINIYVNNKKLQPKLSKYSTLLITLKDKGVNKVKIFYKYTLLARISQFVSLLTWVGMVCYIYRKKIMTKFNK